MSSFEQLPIWKQGLGTRQNDASEKEREKLRSGFDGLRSRASDLASSIAGTNPGLTVHDVTHLDALWGMAQKVVGEEEFDTENPYLNPRETFVLGAAFLIHDLGYSRYALDCTDTQLRADPDYQDTLSSIIQARLPEDQSSYSQVPTKEEEEYALTLFLRAKHAEIATKLPLRFWQGMDGNPHYLLPDPELRNALGEAIGKVAASHHWQVQRLPEEFGIMGAPAFLPASWTCDLLRLACIVRLADAAHIDARRAPAFLAALIRPANKSKMHWEFQEKLHQPVRIGDRLQYTAGGSFALEMVDAWWLCYDTLNMIDRELSEVDSMLADASRHRFAVKSVAGVEDPRRLSVLIPTTGWTPVDTQIRVGNVAALVSRLGGQQLYGDNLLAPLRELVQNAGDAIRARRLLEDRDQFWGQVEVRLIETDGVWVLRVTDCGIGMSEAVLTGSLLDFGTSFWKSREASKEFPGLRASGFEPTGRYGISFFSVFMLGSAVRVISRRYDLGMSETRVLEFRDGVYSRRC